MWSQEVNMSHDDAHNNVSATLPQSSLLLATTAPRAWSPPGPCAPCSPPSCALPCWCPPAAAGSPPSQALYTRQSNEGKMQRQCLATTPAKYSAHHHITAPPLSHLPPRAASPAAPPGPPGTHHHQAAAAHTAAAHTRPVGVTLSPSLPHACMLCLPMYTTCSHHSDKQHSGTLAASRCYGRGNHCPSQVVLPQQPP